MHATGPERYREVSCSRPKHTTQPCRQPGGTALKVPKMTVTCQLLLLFFSFMVYALDCVIAQGTETLCGGELVDTLQFVCGDRGFYFSRPTGRLHRRFSRGIVEECCFRSCDLALLETYCAKPAKNERDISSTSFTALPPLSKDIFRKPSHAKYSKYDVWQRKTTQRLRRGVPAILRARHYRWQAEALENSKEVRLSHPLTATRTQHTLLVRAPSETSDRRKWTSCLTTGRLTSFLFYLLGTTKRRGDCAHSCSFYHSNRVRRGLTPCSSFKTSRTSERRLYKPTEKLV